MNDKIIDIILEDIRELKKDNKAEFLIMNKKIDAVLAFKWQVMGAGIALSGLVTLAFELLRK